MCCVLKMVGVEMAKERDEEFRGKENNAPKPDAWMTIKERQGEEQPWQKLRVFVWG